MKKFKLLFITLLGLVVLYSSCKKDDPLPSTPINITVEDGFSLKVLLSWDESSDADGYYIYRSFYDDEEYYEKIGETESTSFDDLSVDPNSSYYYKIIAYNDTGESDFSSSASATTSNVTADEAFSVLADYTGGKRYDAYSASELPNIIIEIINYYKKQGRSNEDFVFLIDNTGSMDDDIAEIKAALSNIIDNLPIGSNLAMAVYNDANEDPEGWFKWYDLSTDFSEAHVFLDEIQVYGGGDYPESVYDGVYLIVNKLNWKSTSKRMIIVIGDAPPLQGELTQYSLTDVIGICTSTSVDVNLYPILIND